MSHQQKELELTPGNIKRLHSGARELGIAVIPLLAEKKPEVLKHLLGIKKPESNSSKMSEYALFKIVEWAVFQASLMRIDHQESLLADHPLHELGMLLRAAIHAHTKPKPEEEG